jgi:hypothetical protein
VAGSSGGHSGRVENRGQQCLAVSCDLASCMLFLFAAVVVFYLGDIWEWYFDDLTVCTFNLNARCSEGLSGFHAANHATDALTIARHNFNVVFAV